MNPGVALGSIIHLPTPWGVLAMASSNLPAKDGEASTRVTTTARTASKPMISKLFFLMKTSWKKIKMNLSSLLKYHGCPGVVGCRDPGAVKRLNPWGGREGCHRRPWDIGLLRPPRLPGKKFS